MMLSLATAEAVEAQDLEALVMPGEVIRGHAELETECSSCHKLFDKSGQNELCAGCHEEVASDIAANSGFHGLSDDVSEVTCASCHADHLGRDANIVDLDDATFDHDFTDFELVGSHLEVECIDCHEDGNKRRDATNDCGECHKEDDVHEASLGNDCSTCHEPTEWEDATFDHDTTDYPLIGKHEETACLDCHEDQTYQNAPTTCFDCHAEDDAHNGRSGNRCESCHNPTDWNDSSFSHERDTEFALEGKHATLTCGDCHSEDPFVDTMDMACSSCHIEDDSHDEHNGLACNDCHNNDDWLPPTFDHDRDTDYVLRGGHFEVECANCHIEPIFEVALKTTCDTCHLDDEPHGGTLGTQCESCHTEFNWQDPVFFDHDLTDFPLLGKHAENECTDCHETKAFKDIKADCTSCHAADDPHKGIFHDRCDSCHNPVGWDKWSFDHDLQTSFALTGAHISIECANCHRSPLDRMQSVGATCLSCHRADDVHDGEFGSDCGRCHSADSFTEVRSLQ